MTSYRRAAYFIFRILRGAKAAELPVEQPTKFSLGINLNTKGTRYSGARRLIGVRREVFGGILFGTLSERSGRRRCIIIAALLSLPVIPLWAFSDSPALLAIGAFLMQFTVQGAWGVVPVHLNELSPDTARGTFPGFVYQLGNLLASVNATLQAGIASHFGGNYGLALAAVAGAVAVIIAVLTAVGTEAKGIAFAKAKAVVS